MAGKMPISILQELCMKRRCGAPYYDPIADGTDETKLFSYTVEAFNETATGVGKSKKEAKHVAAVNMLAILKEKPDFQADLRDVPQITMQRLPLSDCDAVGMLLDICVQRDWPIAQFTVQQAYGAPHKPEFTVECRLASLTRVGQFSTKKGAKQIAAQEMLKVVQSLMVDEEDMQITPISEDPPEKRIKSYRELKNSDIKDQMGTKLRDRYKFFQKLSNPSKEKMREIFFDINETAQEKVHLLCKAMNWTMAVTPIKDMEGNIKLFELLGANYDVAISGPVPQLYEDVLEYFIEMSRVVNQPSLYV